MERGSGGEVLALLLLCVSLPAAKSAEDYFHGSAYKYISGKQQEALLEAEEGLRAHPDDPRLNSLAGLLKKMNDQQRQDQNQEGGGDQDQDSDQKDKQDQQGDSKEQKGKDSKDGKDQKPEEQQQDKNGADSSGQDEKQTADKGEKEQPQDTTGEASKEAQGRPKPGQMSKEEAEQLLNSFADDEKKEQRKLRAHPGKQPQVEQDW